MLIDKKRRDLTLLARRREQVAAASDRANDRGLGRVDLDLAPDAHDAQIDGSVEGFGVARIGQLQQPFARQHPLRIGREHFQQAEFGRRQRVLVAFVVAQRLGFEVEPFGAEPYQLLLLDLCSRSLRSRRLGRRAAAKHRADARHQFAQLAGFCDVVVGAEFEADDAVDRACGRRQHDDGNVDAALQVANDREPVFLGHVEVEHDEVGHVGLDHGAQAFSAVAQRDAETVHLEVITDHLAGRRLVVDDDDVRALGHVVSVAGSVTVNVDPCPGPPLSAVTWPPCMSMIRLTIDSPRPVEPSPAVGLAESRWKRPNSRPRSSGERPAPWSAMRITVSPPSWVTATAILPPIGEYLMALLTRLSIASRIRSASHMVTTFGGADTAMACCLLTAEGRLESATSVTRAAISTGSRRIVMSKASAIASEIR